MNWEKAEIEAVIQACHTEDGAKQMTGKHKNSYLLWRMLTAIYDRQIADEKTSEHTKYDNGKGFTPGDAKILSNVAKQSAKYKNLTPLQCVKIVAPRMLKYAGQLVKVIKEKAAAAQAEVDKAEAQLNQAYLAQEAEMEKGAYLHKMPLM